MVSKKRNFKKKYKKNKRRTKKIKFLKKVKGRGSFISRASFSRKTERNLLLDKLGKQYGKEIPNEIIDKIVDLSTKYEDDAARTIQKNTKTGFIVTLVLQLFNNPRAPDQTIETFKKWCEDNLANEVKKTGVRICDEIFIDVGDNEDLFMMFVADNVREVEAVNTVNEIKKYSISIGDSNKYYFKVINVNYMQIYGKLPCKTT